MRKQYPNADNTDNMPIEFDDLSDFISKIFDEFENTTNSKKTENKENEVNIKFRFSFSCTVNISILKGDSKEQANEIIKVISDVDEYIWM
jgi:hypothetical protein